MAAGADTTTPPRWALDPRLARARQHAGRGESLQAEVLLRQTLADHPDCLPARCAIAEYLATRDDLEAALQLLAAGGAAAQEDPGALFLQAGLQWRHQQIEAARQTLTLLLARQPGHHPAWLMLGDVCDALGDGLGALRARHTAISRAQRAGRWLNAQTTDPALLQTVLDGMKTFQRDRRARLFEVWADLREQHGAAEMARFERALTGYLGDWDSRPTDPRQRPKFFFFPGLPPGPYHDPDLQPWAPAMRAAWPVLRAEAAQLLQEDRDFVSFLGLAPGQKAPAYVGGDAAEPAWDAFFFYRAGRRFDDHHARCPQTSALLESLDLCRIRHQAPEICFSVLRPQSTIMPHHGVTNTRLVFHLPLIVPPGCALDIVDAAPHVWREGEPVMFDDTFQHGAWNRSDQPRLILLMDCWNPHLTPPEREAVRRVIELIDAIEN